MRPVTKPWLIACRLLFLAIAAVPSLALAQTPSMLEPAVTQLAVGDYHACALTTSGSVKCWGYNHYGELGNDSSVDSNVPVTVVDAGGEPLDNVVAIAAGYAHTCALTTAGGVKCWGYNPDGELGNNSDSNAATPVDVVGLASGVVAIAAGAYHTCALTAGGGVKCWGDNTYGQLGNDSTDDSLVPVDVVDAGGAPLEKATAIAVGTVDSCALTTAGGVKCWGTNAFGGLGDGSHTDSSVPVDVMDGGTPMVGARSIASGDVHFCVIVAQGGVKCWGFNAHGQLGNGTTTDSAEPVTVMDGSGVPLVGVSMIRGGASTTCAVTVAGGAKCWGWNNEGQLGDGSGSDSAVPVDVVNGVGAPIEEIVEIGSGFSHACARTTTGGVECWGDNQFGQLGDGTNADHSTPADVVGLGGRVARLALNSFSTSSCALTTTRGVSCWGENDHGQLGDGTTTNSLVPVPVVDADGVPYSDVAAVAPGDLHACMLTASGGVKCWGGNTYGQLGNDSTDDSLVPVDVVDGTGTPINGMTAIATAYGYSCALATSGGVKCWGLNFNGELGNGTTASSHVAVDVVDANGVPISGMQAISAQDLHACVLTGSGGVECWGYNGDGELGNNSTTNSSIPVDVVYADGAPLTGVASVSAGTQHTCAVTTSGGVKCWGWNIAYQLGNGSNADSHVPVDVIDMGLFEPLSGIVQVSAGGFFTCARTSAGGAKCWGSNSAGQLGSDASDPHAFPADVKDANGVPIDDVAELEAGSVHACVLTTSGRVRCWGGNDDGELGNGSTTGGHVPVDILAGQSLVFAPAATLPVGGTLTLQATASGPGSEAIVFDTWTPDTCTVSGNTLTATARALCGVRASRVGGSDDANGTVADAPQQLRLVRILAATTLGIASDTNPVVYGHEVTFTATLGGADSPVGNVVFCADASTTDASCTGGRLLCAVAADAAPIACTVDDLPSGSHAVTAYYSGDIDNAEAVSTALTQTVDSSGTTTDASVSGPITLGQPVLVTATVQPANGGEGTPTGTVNVSDGEAACAINLPATGCNLTPQSAGTKTITVTYFGDANFGTSNDTVDLVVDKAPSTTTLQGDGNTSVFGQEVNLTASVSGHDPTGTVDFMDGATTLCAGVALDGDGVATCSSASLVVGTHGFSAEYAGDADNEASSAGPLSHTVARAATTTTVSAPAQAMIGQPVTVTAAVAVTAPGSGTPTGSIAVTAGSDFCTIPLPATSCDLTPSSAGNLTLTAVYVGDDDYNGSAGSTSIHVVTPVPDLAVGIDDGRDYVRYGDAVSYVVTVGNHGGGDAHDVEVAGTLPVALANPSWSCHADGSGAACGASGGSGVLFDSGASIPVGGQLTYTIDATVGDIPAGNDDIVAVVQATVAGDGNVADNDATDTTTAVLFRNGFDGTDGAGNPAGFDAAASDVVLDAGSTQVLDIGGAGAGGLHELARLGDAAGGRVRVELLRAGSATYVRLVGERDGAARFGAWSRIPAGTTILAIGIADDGTQRLLLLAGAEQPLQMRLSDAANALRLTPQR